MHSEKLSHSSAIAMCIEREADYRLELSIGETVNVSSNRYPLEYPTIGAFQGCQRQFSTDGAFKITILDSRISVEDTIGIGVGLTPSFASTVYATNAALKMPVRDNHPMSIYVPPSIFGSYMWIVFGVGQEGITPSLHQFSSVNSGFLLEIISCQRTW